MVVPLSTIKNKTVNFTKKNRLLFTAYYYSRNHLLVIFFFNIVSLEVDLKRNDKFPYDFCSFYRDLIPQSQLSQQLIAYFYFSQVLSILDFLNSM